MDNAANDDYIRSNLARCVTFDWITVEHEALVLRAMREGAPIEHHYSERLGREWFSVDTPLSESLEAARRPRALAGVHGRKRGNGPALRRVRRPP